MVRIGGEVQKDLREIRKKIEEGKVTDLLDENFVSNDGVEGITME